ncbi:MAG: endonuclease III [Bacteroidota bacterium]
MTIKERYTHVLGFFSKANPGAETELHYANPYQLLVAVILSAQCTDKRVNIVTPALFKAYPNAEKLAEAHTDDLHEIIKSVSFANNKTKHLVGMGKMLSGKFNNIVPDNIDALTELPGVGRKTANVIVSVIYGQAAMAVDTHVFRVSKRIGLVKNTLKTPRAVEDALMKHIPENQVHVAHHWLILHGRYLCTAPKPKCPVCPITEYCAWFSKHVEGRSAEALKKVIVLDAGKDIDEIRKKTPVRDEVLVL